MSSSQRPSENSVLFSLRELRRIEDDRVKKEQDAARAKAEAERQAKEAADRAAREAEERRVRDEAERARWRREADEQRQREEQLRLQEAERRARVEGEMRINEERMRLEMQHKKKHSPVKAVLTVAGILVVIGGGIGYKMYSQHQTELAVARAEREGPRELDAQEDAGRARGEAARDREEHAEKLKKAKTQADIDRIQPRAHADATGRAGGKQVRPHATPGRDAKADKPVAAQVQGQARDSATIRSIGL